ncbi:amino acid adenylation domain-containing protein [Stappia stellulata]|uniref:non-ribosomal peptide synthetase n=1 Tax=Stappia stellulata TaxID=71235 RepID=UPI001CD38415|nr:non-ribosomal peptide synthetase [Stappia stellulata]MCA1241519.1 amino acid adenylation domain-containing protein [Stappia stellulata]
MRMRDGLQVSPRNPACGPVQAVERRSLAAALDTTLALHGAGIALVDAGGARSYADLRRAGHAVAAYLHDKGIAPGDRIALVGGRSAALVAAQIGCLFAGAVPVPLDPAHPRDRLRMLHEEARPRLTLATDPGVDPVEGTIQALEPFALPAVDGEQWLSDDPDIPAVVYFTSGSTGRPKGVLTAQDGILNEATWTARAFALEPGTRTGWTASSAFAVSRWEVWSALLAGAEIHVAADADLADGPAFARWLERTGVAVTFLATARAGMLRRADFTHRCRLRLLIVGGDVLRAVPEVPETCALINAFGITEASSVRSVEPLTQGAAPDGAIGFPIANTAFYVVRADGRLAGPGETGEIHVGGTGLAIGYLDRPEATAERFVRPAFSGGARVYRTGDLGRIDPETGRIFLSGRAENDAKFGGERISVEEIEQAVAGLLRRPDLCVVDRGVEARPRLVAWLAETAWTLPEAALRRALREKLPVAACPDVYATAPGLPLNAHGKIDRTAIAAWPLPDWSGTRALTDAEARVGRLWQEITGLAPRGPEDRFFATGATSLDAMRLLGGIARMVGVWLELGDLFADDRLCFIAERIGAAGRLETTVFEGAEEGSQLPALPEQVGIWFAEQGSQGHPRYNEAFLFSFDAALGREQVAGAVRAVLASCDALALTMRESAGALRIVPADPLRVEEALAALAVDDGTFDPDAVAATLMADPFDLDTGPLFRARLVAAPDGRSVLVLVLHHAICDGWSLAVLAREFAHRLAAGDAADASAPPAFRAWIARRQAASRDAEADEAGHGAAFGADGCYAGFESGMEQAPAPFCDNPDGRLVVETLPLAADDRARIVAFARAQTTTLFRIGLLAFATLLCRLGDRDRSLVGAFVSARREAADFETVGLMTQTAVLPLRIDEEATVAANLAGTGPALAAGIDASRAGIARLATAFAERGMDVAAVATFSHEQDPDLSGAGLVAASHRPSPFAKFPLSVTLMEDAQGALRLVGEAAVPAAELRLFLKRLRRVLDWMCCSPELALADCPVLLDGEAERVFAAGAGAVRPQPPFLTVSHGIEADLSARADAPGLVRDERTLSAGEVLTLVGGAEALMRAHDVGPGDRVAVLSGPSIVCVVAMLAIWRRGAAFVPIDPAAPEALIRQIAGVAEPRLIVAADGASWPADGSVLALDTETLDRHARPLSGPSLADPDGIAWIYFTSGSTGVPKGVAVAHRAARNHSLLAEFVSDIRPEDRVLQFASPSFDAYIEEVVYAWTHGAALVIRDDAMMGSPARFFDRIREQGVTILDLPTAWFHFIAAGLDTNEARAALRPVHTVIFSGEAARPDAVDAWRAAVAPSCRLVNVYGPTECTISCTYGDLRDPDRPVSVGVAAPNTYCRILDRRRRPLPFGTYGELCFGGLCLAEGYVGAPERTAERFVPDPYGEAGSRLYVTGDRAMLLADGTIHVSGRQDEMVKIRSQRLELGDVEVVARRHSGLADAAAFLPGTEPFADHLLMAIVPRDPEVFDPKAFRAHIARYLPAVAVPQRLLVLDRIPLTTANKIDRRSLRALAAKQARDAADAATLASSDADPEGGSTQGWILARFRAALGDAGLPADADFFLGGGNSLLAMRLLGEIGRRFGAGLLYSEFRAHPTPKRLAALVEARGPTRPVRDPAAVPVATDSAPPLPIQAAKLKVMVEQGDGGAWNQPYVAAFDDGIDADRLQAALERLAIEHFPLSAVWDGDAGLWRRGKGWPAHVRRAVRDQAEAQVAIAEESWRPFDVTREPLFRVVQVDLPDGASWLAFVSHNIMVSGQANDYFTAVMETASGDADMVRPRETDFPHLVAWRAGWERDRRAAARRTWIDRCAAVRDWPVYEAAEVNPVDHRVAILPEGAEAGFVEAMRAAGVTVAAGLARILQDLPEARAGLLGVLVDGREAAGFGGVFAPMAATLPLVVDAGRRGDLAAIQHGLDTAIDGYPFTLSMLEEGLRESGRLTERERAAFVTLSVEQPMAVPVIGGRRGRWLREVNGALRREDTKTVFPLALNVEIDPQGWIVEVTCSTQLLGASRAEAILDDVVGALTSVQATRRSA